MNILQRIAALCGRDYVLMPLYAPGRTVFYLMPIYWYKNWLEDSPFAQQSDGGYVKIDLNGTFFLTPRIKQWAQAQETTRRLEGEAVQKSAGGKLYGGVSAPQQVPKYPSDRELRRLRQQFKDDAGIK